VILCLLLFYLLFLYSIERCFDVILTERDSKSMFFLISIIYLDCPITLNTRIFLGGLEVKKRSKIFWNYIKKHFILDLAAGIATSSFYLLKTNTFYSEIFLLILLKIILDKRNLAQKIKETFVKDSRNAEAIFDMLTLGWKILVSAHIIACLWHFTSYFYIDNHPDSNCWLKERGVLNSPWEDRYLYSVYWSVTTMMTVGYGDVAPKNNWEVFFNIWAMVFGCIIFGYSMNRIGEILKRREEIERILS
jgi:hypothetical protein